MRGLHWFRNDLRLRDHGALSALADRVEEWGALFVFDPDLLDPRLERNRDRFLIESLTSLRAELEERGVPFYTLQGDPEKVVPRLARRLGVEVVSCTEADTPYARRRDEAVRISLEAAGAELLGIRDHTVFGPDEILTKKGTPHSIYSPYKRAWWAAWDAAPRWPANRLRLPKQPIPESPGPSEDAIRKLPTPEAPRIGPAGSEAAARRRLDAFLSTRVGRYATDRDIPSEDGTARLSPYLRFGLLSARRAIAAGLAHAEANPQDREGVEKWLDELVWREFYAAVLAHRPEVTTRNFRPEYDALVWRDDPEGFEAWCAGRTGFPIVDAGMRQLVSTGWMHNRVRMIVASFLTKDLLIDWRRGARFFMDHLVDGDPASNNGGWQWAASTGTDPQPYFRIFNPTKQGERWDPDGTYVRQWIPELRDLATRDIHAPSQAAQPPADYPAPIVDHKAARERALEAYKAARASQA
ncbi:MAG: deoxyribodipyrimidine photo-lyase [Myxococcota bacterium]